MANDGQTLAGQSPTVQQLFNGTYGGNAAAQWDAQHNAALGASGGGPAGMSPAGGQSAQLQSALSNLEAAINSGNQKAYDLALADLMGVFNGQPTEKAREFNLSQGANLLDLAAKLSGPKDYGDFMAFTGGGQRLSQQLMGGRPASSAPVGDMEPMDLASLMQKMGMGPGQGGPTTPAVGGGGTAGGGSTDAPDYSQFPTTVNPGDIAFAKSGQAYDPYAYTNFMKEGGYTPDFVVGDAPDQRQSRWDAFYNSNPGWASGYGNENTSAKDILNVLLNRNANTYVNPNWRNNTVDPSANDLRDVVNAFKGNYLDTGVWGSLPTDFNLQGALKSQYVNDNVPRGNPEPSWFGNYMSTLSSLGPNVNQGAAENLSLLHQLGLDNPQGLQQILNPQGQIDPLKWDQLGPVGQSLMAQAATKVFGWDPTEFQRQIDATRPLGAAMPADSVRTSYAPLAA